MKKIIADSRRPGNRILLIAVAVALAVSLACTGGAPGVANPATSSAASDGTASGTPAPPVSSAVPTMEVESVFRDNGPFPGEYTCDGLNTSPPLHWTGAPEQTKSFAVVMVDPDAGGTFVHWVLYNLAATQFGVQNAMPAQADQKDGSHQGRNTTGQIGYTGPCPPSGATHHYQFVVYALDTMLSLEGGATKDELLAEMKGHIVARGVITGTYSHH